MLKWPIRQWINVKEETSHVIRYDRTKAENERENTVKKHKDKNLRMVCFEVLDMQNIHHVNLRALMRPESWSATESRQTASFYFVRKPGPLIPEIKDTINTQPDLEYGVTLKLVQQKEKHHDRKKMISEHALKSSVK